MGSGAEDESAVGADVAVAPNGLAGVQVGIAADNGQAEIVPGIVQPPCAIWCQAYENSCNKDNINVRLQRQGL